MEIEISSEPVVAPWIPPTQELVTDYTDFELGGIALSDPSQGLKVQAWRMDYNPFSGQFSLTNSLGHTQVIHNEAEVVQCSFCFDQNMNYALVYTTSGGGVYLIWFDSSIPGYTTTALGQIFSPRVTLDDKRRLGVPKSDIILMYALDGAIYQAYQRYRYANPAKYTDGYSSNLRIVNAGMAENMRILTQLTEPPGGVPDQEFPQILNVVPPVAIIGEQYLWYLSAVRGLHPYVWSILRGELPPGLKIHGSSITGTPTREGIFGAILQVRDALGRTNSIRIDFIVRTVI